MRKSLIVAALAAVLAFTAGCRQASLTESHEVVTIDGAVGKLVGNVDRPAVKGSKCPVLIIYHGLTGIRLEDHLNAVADSLFAHGVAIVRFDFNGHGESEGDFVNMTLDNELEDAKMVYDYVAGLDWVDATDIAICGHSQGGLIASVLAGDLGADKVRCAILLAPAACIHTMACEGTMFGHDVSDFPEYIDFWRDTHLGREFVKSAIAMDVYDRASKYDGPVCIIQGTGDTPELVRDALKYGDYLKDCQIDTLSGFTHCYQEDYSQPAKISLDFAREHMGLK